MGTTNITLPSNTFIARALFGIGRTDARKRLLLVGLFAVLYWIGSYTFPDGDWDGWAIWNVRAKMIYQLGFHAAYTAAPELPHLDYPPFLPTSIALIWSATGGAVAAPALVHGAFFLVLLWLMSGASLWAATLVGAAALPYAVTQSADTAIATFLLAAIVAHHYGKPVLTGFLLGLAALTKNEGALMLLSYTLVLTVVHRKPPLLTLMGAAVPLATLLLFKLVLPNHNVLMGSGGILERATDLSRYLAVVGYVVPATPQFGSGVLLLLAVCLWMYHIRVRLTPVVAVVGLIWLGYMAIYVITPYDLYWHMSSSYDRLLLQLFPTLVYALICSSRRTGGNPTAV